MGSGANWAGESAQDGSWLRLRMTLSSHVWDTVLTVDLD